MGDQYEWDVFISHASEDKAAVALPLAQALLKRGFKVWLDTNELTLGDSLRSRIDHGLSKSKYGVVILSNNFFAKQWPTRELNGLTAREVAGTKVILPVWFGVDHSIVAEYSPILADKMAASMNKGVEFVASQIAQVIELSNVGQKETISTTPAQALRIKPTNESRLRKWSIVLLSFVIILAAVGVISFYVRGRNPNRADQSVTSSLSVPSASPSAPGPASPSPASLTGPDTKAAAAHPLNSSTAKDSIGKATQVEAQPSQPFFISVKATEDSWVSVVADGKSVMQGVLPADKRKKIKFRKQLVLRTGNAGGIEVSFNDKPLGPLGNENEPRTLTFLPNGLQR